MTFIDDLTLVLDLLILVTVAVFYTGFCVWFEARRRDTERAVSHLQGGAAILGLLGLGVGIIAVWGETTWPIPPSFGGYDLFFFDALFLLALVLIAFAMLVWRGLPTHFAGIVALVAGSGIIYYGARGYLVGLTLEPLETFLMYLAFGAVGILALPATLYLDWFVVGPVNPKASPLPSGPTPDYPWLWRLLLGLFLLAVVLAGVAAVIYGFTSAWAHLASPP